MRIIHFLVLVQCVLAVATAAAAEDVQPARDAFAAGTAAFARQDYAQALAEFQTALAAGLDGPAIHYNLAASYFKLGDYEPAAKEFSLIAERYPAMRGLAEYNLGLVAKRRGEPDAAADYFEQARDAADDDKIVALAERELRPRTSGRPKRWYSLVSTRFGYDDNVRLVSNDVPVAGGMSAESSSTEFMAVASGPIAADGGFRFDGSLYAIRYQDAPFYDQDYLRTGFVYQWRWGRWLAEAGPHMSRSTLDGDGYERRLGGGFRVRRELAPRLYLGARYVHDEIDAVDDRFSFVEGSRDWLELRLDRRRATGRLVLAYTLESNDRGSAIATARQKIALSYAHDFAGRWTAETEAAMRHSSYDDAAVARDEDLVDLTVSVTRSFARGWALTGTASSASNDSIDPYAYDRSRLSLGFDRTFY